MNGIVITSCMKCIGHDSNTNRTVPYYTFALFSLFLITIIFTILSFFTVKK